MKDIFASLHSITFSTINSNLWNIIRIRLPTFVSLRSMSIDFIDNSNQLSASTLMSIIIDDLLFTVRSLKYLFVSTSYGQSKTIAISPSSCSIQTSTIECLTINGIRINLHEIFIIAPRLRQLNVELTVNQIFDMNTIFQPPYNLQQLSLTIGHITMLEMRHLLAPMIRLTHLTVHIKNVENDLCNGHRWIQLLTRIIVFQFIFEISDKNHVDLDSFRTRFWLEEKKWYVTFDQWLDDSCSILYTHPYYAEYHYPLLSQKKRLMTESTGLVSTTFPHTKYLIFDCHPLIQKNHLCRFTHVQTVTVYGNLNTALDYITNCIDLSRMTCFMQSQWETERSNNEFVRTLHSLPYLRSLVLNVSTVILLFDQHWPQIIDLNIQNNSILSPKSLSSIEIDGLCRSFTHLKRLAFDCENIRNLSELFNNMTTTLSNIQIRQYTNLCDNNLRLITRQWLEQNTKLSNFDYFKDKDRRVYLWL